MLSCVEMSSGQQIYASTTANMIEEFDSKFKQMTINVTFDCGVFNVMCVKHWEMFSAVDNDNLNYLFCTIIHSSKMSSRKEYVKIVQNRARTNTAIQRHTFLYTGDSCIRFLIICEVGMNSYQMAFHRCLYGRCFFNTFKAFLIGMYCHQAFYLSRRRQKGKHDLGPANHFFYYYIQLSFTFQ